MSNSTAIKATKTNATKAIKAALAKADVQDKALQATLSARLLAKMERRNMSAARLERCAGLMVETWTGRPVLTIVKAA